MQTLNAVIAEIDAIIAENAYLKDKLAKLESQPRNNRPKLSDRDVKDIRAAYRGGMPQVELANNYGVNPATISRIVRGFYH